MNDTILLSKEDIIDLLNINEAIYIVEKTFKEYAEKRAINPPKLGLDLGESGSWPGYNSFMNAMPAYVGWLDIAGLKWAGGFWDNIKKGLPTISALILLVDPRTGFFKAVMEGSYITAIRTAASSAVGVKYLANTNSEIITIFGAGTQGRYQAIVISKIIKPKKIKVFDINKEAVRHYIKEMSNKLNIDIISASSIKDAAMNSDIIVTATNSKKPFIKSDWIGQGTLIISIGSYQELYSDVVLTCHKIVVDHIEQCMHRGTLKPLFELGLINKKDIYATIGEIVAGAKKGREKNNEIILYNHIGMGALDVAVASYVYEKALKKGSYNTFKFI